MAEPTTSRSRLGRRMLLSLVSLLLSLGLVEGVLRLVSTNPYARESPDRYLELRVHHTGKATVLDRSAIDPSHPVGLMRTDARSYILPSGRFEHPDATIVFIGGSTTECSAVEEQLRFPALVSTLLEQYGLHVNSLNSGRAGNTMHDALNILLNHVAEDRPDAVVLMHAANDIGMLYHAGSYRPRMGGQLTPLLVGKWLLQVASKHSALAARLRSALSSGRVHKPGDFGRRGSLERERLPLARKPYLWRLRGFVALARAFEIEPVLMTQPAISMRHPHRPAWLDLSNQAVFNDLIRQVARDEGVILIDLARHLAERVPDWDQPMVVFYDGIHVTDQGSSIYAEHITERLLETLFAPAG